MADCLYTYKDSTYNSYGELIDSFKEDEYSNIVDVLFDADTNHSNGDVVYDNLLKLNVKANEKTSTDLINGTSNFESEDSDDISLQKFLNTVSILDENGEQADYTKHWAEKMDEYLEMLRSKMASRGLSQDEITASIIQIQNHWKEMHSASFELHKLLAMAPAADSEWSRRVINTPFQGLSSAVKNAEESITKKIYANNPGITEDGKWASNLHIIKNFNFKSELIDSTQKLFAHADFITVNKTTGEVQVYNYKISSEPFEEWSLSKKIKYRYELAFIKQMLVNNGVPPQKIRLYYIPVQMVFDNSFSHVKDIVVHPKAIPVDYVGQRYVCNYEDSVAKNYIPSKVVVDKFKSETLDKVSDIQSLVFDDINLSSKGIAMTAEQYIKVNRNRFLKVKLADGRYKITMPGGEKSLITLDKNIDKTNKELVDFISKEMLNELEDQSNTSIEIFQDQMKNSLITSSPPYSLSGKKGHYLNQLFRQYFEGHPSENNEDIIIKDWRKVDIPELDAAHMILLENKSSGQLDVILLTEKDLDTVVKGKKGNNLLGNFISDVNNHNFVLKRNFANIEMTRALLLLNEVVPQLSNFHLGTLYIVNPLEGMGNKACAMYNIEQYMRDFTTIINVTNGAKKANIENHFLNGGVKFVDAISSLYDIYSSMTSNYEATELNYLMKFFVGETSMDSNKTIGLLGVQDQNVRRVKLKAFIVELQNLAKHYGIPYGKPKELISIINNRDKQRANIALLLTKAYETYNVLNGDFVKDIEDLTWFEENMIKPDDISNNELRITAKLLADTNVRLKSCIVDKYITDIRPTLLRFEDDMNHSKFRDYTLGDRGRLFKNLFQYDTDGKNTFMLKDPYDSNNGLLDGERRYLKKMLFEINKVRAEMNGKTWIYKDENDSRLANVSERPENYLYAPLTHASEASKCLSIPKRLKAWAKRCERVFKNSEEFLAEFEELTNPKDRRVRDQYKENLNAYNYFKSSDTDISVRNELIEKKGEGYFETNLDNIYLEFLSAHERESAMNDLLIRINSIEAVLALRGETCGDTKITDHIIKLINDYVDINIYKVGIMSDAAKKIVQFFEPVRRWVSRLTVMANPIAMNRDPLSGLQNGFLNALMKFDDQRDITAKDILYAIKTMIKNGPANLQSLSLLNQINIRYGFSNFDNADVAQRLKSDRYGLTNIESFLFLSVKAPDYFNRMLLFLARAHKDGVIDAFSLDENGNLKYDWKKDKRFSAYAKGNASDPQYKIQKALYLSKLRQFQEESPDLNLDAESDLPDPYTFMEIRNIKSVAEEMFGAYDKNLKSKFEFGAIGHFFLMYFTWMNGLLSTYWKRPQISEKLLKPVQKTDANGNRLFVNPETLELTTEDTGYPYETMEPQMVEGVCQTLSRSFKALKNGGFEAFKDDVLGTSVGKNNLKRLARDMLWLALTCAFFKLLITPAYKKHKKEDNGEEFIKNVMLEWIYKGAYHSTDVFAGPLNVIRYFGSSTTPLPYTYSVRLLEDAWGVLVGQKALNTTLMRESAFTRSMNDAYTMYLRDKKKLEKKNESNKGKPNRNRPKATSTSETKNE